MDLSKAFDSLNHEPLLTKLKAYGLDSNSVTFMKSYLTNRLQRFKINNSSSEWGKVLNFVPQGSILGPLLFNIFLSDIFLSLQRCDVANYGDDSTLYTSDKSISNTIILQAMILLFCQNGSTIVSWFLTLINVPLCY